MENKEQLNILKTKLNKRKNQNVIPGQTYRLPSLGKKYHNGEVSDEVVDGEIVLYPMSTLDEIYLKTPDMLFQGTAVEEVLSRRAPQILKPLELIPKDVDYILSALRLITYGDKLDINYTCSNTECNHKNINAVAKISNFLRKTKTLENFDESKLKFEIDSFLFEIKFSTYGDLIKLNQKNVNNIMDTPVEIYNVFIDNLSINIKSIDDIDDQETIHSFLYNDIDSTFQHKILEHIQKINEWGVEFNQEFICTKCGHKNDVPIAINPVSFFSQPSDQVI